MRIVTVGGGPAGLYFSLLMKRADPSHRVTVIERNPPDATFGWGVVFSEETLGSLREADPKSYDEIAGAFATWDAIDIRYRGRNVRSRGHAFSAIARKRLLNILQRRCAELGVELRFETEADPDAALDADLVVAADGVNSRIRTARDGVFKPALHVHRTKYVWFGTPLALPAFTFAFRENEHGLHQAHAYPFDAGTSTFIVECPEETWQRAELEDASEADSIAYCERLFAEDLQGRPLLSNKSAWISFVTLRCETWHDGNLVLMGDAAHTAHFTIGSGTKLAMEDAVALANGLERHGDLEPAITDYELERQPVVERFQQAAMESSRYFENVRRYASFDPTQFAFNLLTRSGRITHLSLELRDPRLVSVVDGWFAGVGADRPLVAPPPLLAPLALRDARLPNRVAVTLAGSEATVDGSPGSPAEGPALAAAASGAGLIVTDLVAVTPGGRVTPGSPCLDRRGHADPWRGLIDRIHRETPAAVAVQLGHAGPRGATRPHRDGVDLPLRSGAWPLVSASALPYSSRAQTPREASREDLTAIRDAFATSAALAAEVGFDVLELNAAQGYLLAAFISPLTNRRTDGYGGSPEARLRFPLEVVEAVRGAWPEGRPLAVRITATDWTRGGGELEDAVVAARAFAERGCDLVHVRAGQTVPWDAPTYGRFYLVPYADVVRNEAGVATMVGGHLTTADEVNTILAAGRADLCAMDPMG